ARRRLTCSARRAGRRARSEHVIYPKRPKVDVEERTRDMAQAWMELRDAMALVVPADATGAPTIRAVNRAFTSLFATSEAAVRGQPLDSLLSGADIDRLRERAGADEEARSVSELVAAGDGSGGSVLVDWELAPARDAAGQIWAFVCVFRHPSVV